MPFDFYSSLRSIGLIKIKVLILRMYKIFGFGDVKGGNKFVGGLGFCLNIISALLNCQCKFRNFQLPEELETFG